MKPLRAAFVMEQTLGHVTHWRNLTVAAATRVDVRPTWLPIPFAAGRASRLLPVMGSNWSVRASWRAQRALGATLANGPLDAVLFHTQVTALLSVPIMRRVPSVVSLDATPINYDSVGQYYGHRPAGNGWVDRQKHRMNQRVFQSAARLVAWSEWARNSLVDDYGVDPTRVRVIAPGAAPAFFEIGERRFEAPAPQAPEPPEPPEQPEQTERRLVRLLFVGGDFERKGGPLLLECMHAGLAERCELHLVTQADVAPQPHVIVHRGLTANSPELRRLYAEADVFVLPTLADCLCLAIMEAMAAGLPVVTTDVGALREAVRPGGSGFLTRPGDRSGLRDAIESLAHDAALRERMGKLGHTLARQWFDAEANNRALLNVLVEAAETGASSGRRE